MNEQIIRKLLAEALDNDTIIASRTFGHWPLYDEDLEKFAELIVQECIGCCEQVISDPVPESVDTWLNGGSQCIEEIKQHFGVEE